MKKCLVAIFTLFIIPNAYAEMKDCKYKLDLFGDEEIYNSFMNNDNYSYNNANGKICFIYNADKSDFKLYRAFELKNGKIVGSIEEVAYSDNLPEWAFYISNRKFFDEICESLDQNFSMV